jgi:hypothetical protein
MTKAEEIFYKHLSDADVKHVADKRFLTERLIDAINEALNICDRNIKVLPKDSSNSELLCGCGWEGDYIHLTENEEGYNLCPECGAEFD